MSSAFLLLRENEFASIFHGKCSRVRGAQRAAHIVTLCRAEEPAPPREPVLITTLDVNIVQSPGCERRSEPWT